MAGSSLFALLDDIATLLDDISLMSKVAAKKSATVLSDDLAVNAEQVIGMKADRELPVVWAVAKGSMINKAILVPAALLISVVAPWAITPLLMLGGLFLCYEGVEKLVHAFGAHKAEDEAEHAKLLQAVADKNVDLVAFEKEKIKGAVRTDFILSAEIIVISLGTVADKSFTVQVGVLLAIAALMTVGVYGLVAGIVKLDDAGLHLSRSPSGAAQALGRGILRVAPWLMKALSVAGTAAMFLVGGGILVHGLPFLHHLTEGLPLGFVWDGLIGVVAGALVLAAVTLVQRVRGGLKAN